jgi:hypothetical protein
VFLPVAALGLGQAFQIPQDAFQGRRKLVQYHASATVLMVLEAPGWPACAAASR